MKLLATKFSKQFLELDW